MQSLTEFGLETIELSSPQLIEALYRQGTVELRGAVDGVEELEGGFVVLRYGSQSALALVFNQEVQLVKDTLDFQGVKPRDAAQTCFMWALKNRQLTVCLGAAGCGKTYIATAFAVHQMMKQDKKTVFLKPTRFVGGESNAIAAVPGGVAEKLEPYVESFLQHLRSLLGADASNLLGKWQQKRQIEFAAVELCRGRHFANSVVILDEAQNLTFHELCSVISRVDDSSTLIVMGDPLQIDIEGRAWEETGLARLLESSAWWSAPFAVALELETSYRGKLARLVGDALREQY